MPREISIMLEYLTQQCWMMHLPVLRQMRDIVVRHIEGARLAPAEIKAVVESRKEPARTGFEINEASGYAIIPVTGVIAKHSGLLHDISEPDGTSFDELNSQLDAALADPRARGILFLFETPGGTAAGCAEFADRIWDAGSVKPTVGFIDDLCASAGYYLASQCVRIYCTQGAYVGSIGTYAVLYDTSKMIAGMGVETYIVRSGEHKGIGVDGVEITDANLAMVQSNINSLSELFVSAVARGRLHAGLSMKSLREIADGRTLIGAESVRAKLSDGVATLEQVLRAEMPRIRAATSAPTQKTAAGAADTNPSLKGHDMTAENKDAAAGAAQTSDAALSAARNEARKAEQDRITAINAALPGESLAQVREKAIKDGLSIDQAKAAAFDHVKQTAAADAAAKDAELSDARARLAATAKSGVTTEAPKASDAADAGAMKSDGPDATLWQTFERHLMKENPNLTAAAARQLAVRRYPESHDAWLATQYDAKQKGSPSKAG